MNTDEKNKNEITEELIRWTYGADDQSVIKSGHKNIWRRAKDD